MQIRLQFNDIRRYLAVFCILFAVGAFVLRQVNSRNVPQMSLLQLICNSNALTVEKQTYWIRTLAKMSPDQRAELRETLERKQAEFASLAEYSQRPVANPPELKTLTVSNRTSIPVKLRGHGYYDPNGQSVDIPGVWLVEANQNAELLSDGKPICCSQFVYQVEVDSTVYPGPETVSSAFYEPGKGVVVEITRATFQRPEDNFDASIQRAGESLGKLVEQVADAVEFYDDNVKPVVSAYKNFRDRKSVQVHLDSVRVYEHKRNGQAWDGGQTRPDPFVRMKVKKFGGDRYESDVVEDTLYAQFGVAAVEANVGDDLEVTVVDFDAWADDEIGSTRREITQAMIDRGRVEWSFGQVGSLVLYFE